ncbi:MAG: OmpA family protein [Pseudomonadota bacterium]|nr:OmpA family protein [Pseudomonadota bacterium]
MNPPLIAVLAVVVALAGGAVGWLGRGSDFGIQLAEPNGAAGAGFVLVSAPDQAQLVSIMDALDVPATPQAGLSGETVVNLSAALSALRERSDEIAAAAAEQAAAIENARAAAEAALSAQAAELTAAHTAAQAALEAANLALQGDVEAREAELAAVALEMADTQQKYDGTLSQINALQLERNALTAETQRLSELSQASLDRLEAIGDSDTVLLIIERQQIEAALTDMRAERDTLQQTLLDLITQIDAAKVDIEDIEAEQQTRQRLLEALRLEGERLTTRQSEAEAALGPAEAAVFAAQTEAEALRIEAEALQDAVTSSRADRDRVLDAIASFGASVEASGQVLINGDPITADAAVDTLRRTLEREQQARDQLVKLQDQMEAVSAERVAIDASIEAAAADLAAVVEAEADARIATAEDQVAALEIRLLETASERERRLETQLSELEATMEADIANAVSERVTEALAASMNAGEAALLAQADARAQAQMDAELTRLTETLRNQADLRLEQERIALTRAFNANLEDRAGELATELAQRLIEDGEIAATAEAQAEATENVAAALDLSIDRSAAMTAIRERLYDRLLQTAQTEFGYVPRVIGERLLLESNGLFPVGSPDLSREGQEELRIFGQQLERILASLDDEDFMIRVDGHADIKPYLFSPYGNWDLSSQRAVSVVEFLIENTDIPADRLMVAAFGEHKPLVEGEDESAQRQNRRIEFKLVRR